LLGSYTYKIAMRMIFIFTYMQERGVALRISCCVWRFGHGMTYVWRRVVCRVCTTCKWRNQDVGVWAGASWRVYMAGRA